MKKIFTQMNTVIAHSACADLAYANRKFDNIVLQDDGLQPASDLAILLAPENHYFHRITAQREQCKPAA